MHPTLRDVVQALAEKRIGFCAGFPGTTDNTMWTIEVKQNLNNEQLGVLVALGGSLAPDGIVRLIGDKYYSI